VAEGRIGALAGTGAEAIERHREVVRPNALHALPPFIRTQVWYAVVSRISNFLGAPSALSDGRRACGPAPLLEWAEQLRVNLARNAGATIFVRLNGRTVEITDWGEITNWRRTAVRSPFRTTGTRNRYTRSA